MICSAVLLLPFLTSGVCSYPDTGYIAEYQQSGFPDAPSPHDLLLAEALLKLIMR